MAIQNRDWTKIHASVFRQAGSMLRWALAAPRSGAVRYRCPVTGSFVLVTDEASLRNFDRPTTRLRCAGCGEMHLLSAACGEAPVIVGNGHKL